VGRLIEQGAINVKPMNPRETRKIFETAEVLFKGIVSFTDDVVDEIVQISAGFPYFAQLIGKASVQYGNEIGSNKIDKKVFAEIMDRIRTGNTNTHIE
jgi:hypothetical protein